MRVSKVAAMVFLVVGTLSACFASGADPGTSSAGTGTRGGTSTAVQPTAPSATTAMPTAATPTPDATTVRAAPTSPPSAPPPPALARATVVLASLLFDQRAQEVQAAGYVESIVEDDGTCTLTLTATATAGAPAVLGVRPAAADASTTSCGSLTIPRSALSSGAWTAVLTYASALHSGSSAPTPIQVP